MSDLDRAVHIAVEAHRGQTDKAGEPYILHVVRVVCAVSAPDARVVAALHDVVEKNEAWTLERLAAESFPPNIIQAVDALTRRPGEGDENLVNRCAAVPLAREVKVADLHDNIRQTRVMAQGADPDGSETKFTRALQQLGELPLADL